MDDTRCFSRWGYRRISQCKILFTFVIAMPADRVQVRTDASSRKIHIINIKTTQPTHYMRQVPLNGGRSLSWCCVSCVCVWQKPPDFPYTLFLLYHHSK